MVMTTRLPLNLLNPDAPDSSQPSESCFMVWLTGLCPTRNPVHITLTVWRRPHKHQPLLHRVLSGVLYSIRMPQSSVQVFRSGHGLVLTSEQCRSATADGKKLLKMQVRVH